VVEVDVVVTNGQDEPVSGLHKKDFQVFENGKLQSRERSTGSSAVDR